MIGMRRHIGIAEALISLRPNAEFAVRDDSYDNIEWHSTNQTMPSKEEIEIEIENLKQQEPMRVLREIRDWYLKNTDWTQGVDIRALRGQEWCNSWDFYRQQLRDITINQTPYFENDFVMHLSGIVWPEQPNSK